MALATLAASALEWGGGRKQQHNPEPDRAAQLGAGEESWLGVGGGKGEGEVAVRSSAGSCCLVSGRKEAGLGLWFAAPRQFCSSQEAELVCGGGGCQFLPPLASRGGEEESSTRHKYGALEAPDPGQWGGKLLVSPPPG